MEREAILDGLAHYVEDYAAGDAGHVTDDLHKHAVFALFRAAYRGGFTGRDSDHSLSADRVADEVYQRLPLALRDHGEIVQLLEHMRRAWIEWTYALDRQDEA